jgi:Kef-type K+ transport system membrane component KefB
VIYWSITSLPELKGKSRKERFIINRQVSQSLNVGPKLLGVAVVAVVVGVSLAATLAAMGFGESTLLWSFYVGTLVSWLAGYLYLVNVMVRPAVKDIVSQANAGEQRK